MKKPSILKVRKISDVIAVAMYPGGIRSRTPARSHQRLVEFAAILVGEREIEVRARICRIDTQRFEIRFVCQFAAP